MLPGYFMPDAPRGYSIDDPEHANYPDGQASPEGLAGWFLAGSFRFCPSCGVEHNVRGSEFRKLCGLSSEGRSSATTTLSLSVLRQLLHFPSEELPDNARKLLAFSDNRQDASLQAGHFNDFMRVLQLRAGLVAALQAQPDLELSLETLALETEKALRLEADDFGDIGGATPMLAARPLMPVRSTSPQGRVAYGGSALLMSGAHYGLSLGGQFKASAENLLATKPSLLTLPRGSDRTSKEDG